MPPTSTIDRAGVHTGTTTDAVEGLSEIFPTRIRGVAASFSVMCLWGGNYLVSQFFPAMLSLLGGAVFYVYALMCLFCFGFIWCFLPETKGQTLEQIEAKFFGVNSAQK